MSGHFSHKSIRASAGSGKTHQLTNRYLGLLGAGIQPDAILATTFTRKAAGEILDRVLERLAGAADDAATAMELATQILAPNTSAQDFAALLRRLLRNLHRVRIKTLDSFHMAVAGSFSLELGLPAGWSICEELDDELMRQEALERLLDRQPEEIEKLLPLLGKGETKRSVHAELHDVSARHYEIFRGSEKAAWECLQVPPHVAAATCAAALNQLRVLDLSAFGHKGFSTARDNDIAKFEREDWQAFIAAGLAAKVIKGETTYNRKPVPPSAIALYETLIAKARYEIVRKLAEQTKATWELLNRYHGELWTLKQATGQLYFGEVTHTLVVGLHSHSLAAKDLAFRLDGAIEHLLLDEFQDTSLAQWNVIKPLAQAITQAAGDPPRSFFCVGDVKQAIYGWRGGMAGILNTLSASLGPLEESPLVESRRSAQPIIDVVNKVFGNLNQFEAGDNQAGINAWGERFEPHTTFKKEAPGYVCLVAGPEQEEGESVKEQRGRHFAFVAEKIRELAASIPDRSIGVLCRKQETVARIIYELRERDVAASEEGGNPLTDSPAVELMMSLFSLADHPAHSAAWFHLQNSPLRGYLAQPATAEAFSRQLRAAVLTEGYGKFTHGWAARMATACNQRDLSRLQQLVESAYAYQPRSTLRADDFVAWVRKKRVPDPSAASVRVMTIHAAKGLEFDAVVLPELDVRLAGQPPAFVVGRDPQTLAPNFVCRYAAEAAQQLLGEKERGAFDHDRQQTVEESLSLLYVAMTRAIHALYLCIPGPRGGKFSGSANWHNLLLQAIVPQAQPAGGIVLFEHGDRSWSQRLSAEQPPAVQTPPHPARISFRTDPAKPRRGLEHVAPSRREGQAQVPLHRLFNPSEGTGTAAGTLYHAWFEAIAWLDDGAPAETELRTIAAKHRFSLPAQTLLDLDKLLTNFRSWLQKPAINGVLSRGAYADPKQPAFPAALAAIWTPTLKPQKVERERRFLQRDGDTFWNGSLDRIVWIADGERTVAADILDFKTDQITPGDEEALGQRTEHYRPQLEAYRRVVAQMARLPPDCVAARLVFTNAGRVVAI